MGKERNPIRRAIEWLQHRKEPLPRPYKPSAQALEIRQICQQMANGALNVVTNGLNSDLHEQTTKLLAVSLEKAAFHYTYDDQSSQRQRGLSREDFSEVSTYYEGEQVRMQEEVYASFGVNDPVLQARLIGLHGWVKGIAEKTVQDTYHSERPKEGILKSRLTEDVEEIRKLDVWMGELLASARSR